MKKTLGAKERSTDRQILRERRFDYRKAKQNRFAEREIEGVVVMLDEDVAQAFPTPDAVNKALRTLISPAEPRHAKR